VFLSPPPLLQAAADVIAPAAAVSVDGEMRVVAAEGTAFARHGLSPEDWTGRLLVDLVPESVRAQIVERWATALKGERQSFDYWSRDGHHGYWIQIAAATAEDGTEQVVAIAQDITERLRAMGELERSQSRLQEAERLVGVGSWELHPDTERLTFSPGFARLLGLAPDQVLTLSGLLEMVLPEDRDVLTRAVEECVARGTSECEYRLCSLDGVLRIIRGQGEAVAAAEGRSPLLHGAILDVTEARSAERERLAGLSLFREGFDLAPIGMVLTDPVEGRYLRVNDAMCGLLGRPREELLGLTYADVTHPEDITPDEESRQTMREGRGSSHHAEKRYVLPDGSTLWAAVHITAVRTEGGSVEAFFTQVVDISERKAREARMRGDSADATWLARIRAALDEDRFVLYRQPVVELATGRTVQNELLLRLVGEDGTVHAPGEFLGVAERYGLISEIDRWVIREAGRIAAAGEPIEFNISARSLGDGDVLRELEDVIADEGVDPGLLVVEVTETAVVSELDVARRFAERVAELGCGLALDDFGTGHANLSYLKHLPADHLKIDVEFIRDIARSETDRRLVAGMVSFARGFHQVTVAEGVEDEDTLMVLRELGVDRAQGYLFGRPAPHPRSGRQPAARDGECGEDRVGLVKSAFEAFARRDLPALSGMCVPDVLVRPAGTAALAGRQGGYRGLEGLHEYFDDLGSVWKRLDLRPRTFRAAEASILVFGEVEGETANGRAIADVIWVWRIRGELVASVEAFQVPRPTI
jgi:PAS domain S-box-containing protein